MDSGADDLVVGQASQPAHSLGEEGRKLAGIDSVSLLPHFAQSGGFRIESKLLLVFDDRPWIVYVWHSRIMPLLNWNGISQICFDPETTSGWIRGVRERGWSCLSTSGYPVL